jgi:V8-like Glu-specific endopeptidase
MTAISRVQDRVVSATVHFPRQGGQGVVVPGLMIVTAAHVIAKEGFWDYGGLANHFEEVVVGGKTWTAALRAADPVSDVAVLDVPLQDLEEGLDFHDHLQTISPVRLFTADLPHRTPVPVFVWTHTKRWVKGSTKQVRVNQSMFDIEAEEDIVGGTSGSPVVTEKGLLVGVVSTAGGPIGKSREVKCARLHLTVPEFLLRLMRDPKWEFRRNQKQIAQEEQRRGSGTCA